MSPPVDRISLSTFESYICIKSAYFSAHNLEIFTTLTFLCQRTEQQQIHWWCCVTQEHTGRTVDWTLCDSWSQSSSPPLIPLELCLHSASQQQGPVRAALHTSCCCFSLWIIRTQLSLRPHTLSSSHCPLHTVLFTLSSSHSPLQRSCPPSQSLQWTGWTL